MVQIFYLRLFILGFYQRAKAEDLRHQATDARLKLLEAQLITYHKGDKAYSFLNLDKTKVCGNRAYNVTNSNGVFVGCRE